MRRALLLACLLLPLWSARADAVTIRDLIELSRAGLGDEVLLALIEVDRSVLPVDANTIKTLKEAGVSEPVILAVIRSGREEPVPAAESAPLLTDPVPPEPAPEPAPQPQVVVIDHQEAPVQQYVPVAVPVFVPVVPVRQHRVDCRDVQPVYWGFGGKLRPDAWQPRIARHCR
jgi:hypothetical protein